MTPQRLPAPGVVADCEGVDVETVQATCPGCDQEISAPRRYCSDRCKWRIKGLRRRRAAGVQPMKPRGTCSEPGCSRPHEARALCVMHYKRVLKAERGGSQRARSGDVILGGLADTPAGRRNVPVRVIAQVVLATRGMFVYCPNPGHTTRTLMGARCLLERHCACGATVTLNEEEVAVVISETTASAA